LALSNENLNLFDSAVRQDPQLVSMLVTALQVLKSEVTKPRNNSDLFQVLSELLGADNAEIKEHTQAQMLFQAFSELLGADHPKVIETRDAFMKALPSPRQEEDKGDDEEP